MSTNEKDQTNGEIRKNHAARCEKDVSRVCPSKLSKRELEDLYYSVLDSNMELKRAVNSQNVKIRQMTTKLNRMTAQNKIYMPKDQRDCCAGAKAIINNQKEAIADLKRANEYMSERIKRLNMRLCSARQFLKKSPSQTINRVVTVKNQSTSALNGKGSDANITTTALSPNDRESPITKTVETNTLDWQTLIQELIPEKLCDENICRSTMDEFKQKIVDLQEELSKSRSEHSRRMSELEQQVGALQAARAQGDRSRQRERERETRQAAERDELAQRLSAERMKVADLEMRLKAAELSKNVASAIETHLNHVNQLEEKRRSAQNDSRRPSRISIAQTQTELPKSSKLPESAFEDRQTASDDSGYVDNHPECEKEERNTRSYQELVEKITQLQDQLDYVRSLMVEPPDVPNKTFESYNTVVKASELTLLKNGKDFDSFIIDSNSKVMLQIPHINKDTDHDDKLMNSDIERKDKLPTREQASMKYDLKLKDKSKESTLEEHEKPINPYKDSKSNTARRRTVALEGENSVHTPENFLRETIFNGTVKPLEEYDEYLSHNEQSPREDGKYSAVPTATKQKGNKKKVKCKKNVICECPKCEVTEPADDCKMFGCGMDSENFDNKVQKPIPQEAMRNQPKNKPDSHNSMQIPGPVPTSRRDSIASRISKASNKLSKENDNSGTNISNVDDINEASEQDERRKYRRSVGTTNKMADVDDLSTNDHLPVTVKYIRKKTSNYTEDIKPSTSENKFLNRENQLEDDSNTGVNQEKVTERQSPYRVKDIVTECKSAKEETERLNEVPNAGCSHYGRDADRVEKLFETCGSVDKDLTYSVTPPERRSRSATPDNTECEISFMSDLPTEREDTSTRTLSPGEHKMTKTQRESYAPCHWSSLSEGEVPNETHTKKISISERGQVNGNNARPEPADEMEAALRTISRELARCRLMLQSRRPGEHSVRPSKDAEAATDLDREESISLRKTQAYPSLVSMPKCVFTLHFGTIVLSDEAVIDTRDVPLMLRWKFFGQNVAMARMGPGRVVHFHFSTEYQVELTEDFVQYMRHVQMPITICGMDDKEGVFAVCTLPMREALLNAQRRVDLSLQLLAGSQMRRLGVLDNSDEVGVMDLWCMLRIEPRNHSRVRGNHRPV